MKDSAQDSLAQVLFSCDIMDTLKSLSTHNNTSEELF